MSEAERIRETYERYDKDAKVQNRRNQINVGNRVSLEERERRIREALDNYHCFPLKDRTILDIGCGHGGLLASLVEWGARPENLYGIDLLLDRIATAKRMHAEIHFECGNAEHLDFHDSSFDIIIFFTVFSSILHAKMAQNVAHEASRLLKPSGIILWYDFRYNNPWNPNVHGMTRQGIRKLFPDFQLRLRPVTLLPPLARRLGKLTTPLYPLLSMFSPLQTHYLGLLTKPQRQDSPR